MKFERFINKEVINKNNEKGLVISFDDDYVVVRYTDEEKTYSYEIVFKNKFLTFVDDKLNQTIERDLLSKEQQKTKQLEQITKFRKNVIKRNKRIRETFYRLSAKKSYLQTIFGYDFIYPPYSDFVRKNQNILK